MDCCYWSNSMPHLWSLCRYFNCQCDSYWCPLPVAIVSPVVRDDSHFNYDGSYVDNVGEASRMIWSWWPTMMMCQSDSFVFDLNAAMALCVHFMWIIVRPFGCLSIVSNCLSVRVSALALNELVSVLFIQKCIRLVGRTCSLVLNINDVCLINNLFVEEDWVDAVGGGLYLLSPQNMVRYYCVED